MKILAGDCLVTLATLRAESVQCCVTSPPYYGLRDYGHAGQIGLEETPEEYIARLVAVFREVRRVLRSDGTLWLNLGDSYAREPAKGGSGPGGKNVAAYGAAYTGFKGMGQAKPKDLLMIPAQVALALRADGWWLRKDIIWHKPNPMPESVRDRPTSAHEHLFLLAKSPAYFYDADAIAEDAEYPPGCGHEDVPQGGFKGKSANGISGRNDKAFRAIRQKRNARDVWTIATQPYSGAHFATMPPALAERCIKAGTRHGDVVLDPFGGAGTTGLVANRLGRNAILCELNPAYIDIAKHRLRREAPILAALAANSCAGTQASP